MDTCTTFYICNTRCAWMIMKLKALRFMMNKGEMAERMDGRNIHAVNTTTLEIMIILLNFTFVLCCGFSYNFTYFWSNMFVIFNCLRVAPTQLFLELKLMKQLWENFIAEIHWVSKIWNLIVCHENNRQGLYSHHRISVVVVEKVSTFLISLPELPDFFGPGKFVQNKFWLYRTT